MTHKIVKNFSLVFFAQIVILLVSVVRAIVLPKFLSVESFGYWSIYWFYTSYTAMFCLGYNDGLYLNYGGYEFRQLPIKLIRSANKLFVWGLASIASIACVLTGLLFKDKPEAFLCIFIFLNIPTVCLTGVFTHIFQITNKFKDYAFYSTIDKILVLLVIILLIFSKNANYKYIVVADFVGRLIVLLIMAYKLRLLLIGETEPLSESSAFLWDNMQDGIKLMIANLMGMLLIGGGRIIVQMLGNITDFALYSFGFSITGLILTAVSAVSLVLYPSIKKFPSERYPSLFVDVNAFTRLVGICSLLLYFPCFIFLEWFYPNYSAILPFLNLFFLIVYANIKISVLTNTFFNVLRKENTMLISNLICVLIFLVIGIIAYSFISEIWIIALCTFIALAIRCFSAEIYLARLMNIGLSKSMITELSYLGLFAISSCCFSLGKAFVIMSIGFIVWNVMNIDATRWLIKKIRN